MNTQEYRPSAMLMFAIKQTIDQFGIWVGVLMLNMVLIIFELLGVAFVVAFVVRTVGQSLVGSSFFCVPQPWDTYLSSTTFVVIASLIALFCELFGGVVRMGAVQIAQDLYAGKNPSFGRVFAHPALAWSHLAAMLLYTFSVLLGLCFFVIPGIIIAIRLGFYRQIMVDRQCSAMEALGASRALTKGKMAVLLPAVALLAIVQFPVGSVGLWGLVSYPMSVLSGTFLYRCGLSSR
ncbi:TPA: hypothetical protein DDZ86_00130 [Candidatus Dependentiae bacterium]|nr:MAG: hypothetical protein UW09_C0002G0093 [candidate division TM6 bacterium GW2011_GWF2_43_87]HBL98035.1 hypothetical protein [Candidatus Dependentiae bacterium]